MEIKVQHAIFKGIKIQNEIETNLWILLSSYIYTHSKGKPWCTSFVLAPEGAPFILP